MKGCKISITDTLMHCNISKKKEQHHKGLLFYYYCITSDYYIFVKYEDKKSQNKLLVGSDELLLSCHKVYIR